MLELPDDLQVTAIIAANDDLAAAAMHAALARGWRVPEDVCVAGWDNNGVGEWTTPPLTSVKVDYEELGRRAMTQLLATIHDEAPPTYSRPIGEVVWRESTDADAKQVRHH